MNFFAIEIDLSTDRIAVRTGNLQNYFHDHSFIKLSGVYTMQETFSSLKMSVNEIEGKYPSMNLWKKDAVKVFFQYEVSLKY